MIISFVYLFLDRQMDRQRDKQRDRQIKIWIDREIHRQIDRQMEVKRNTILEHDYYFCLLVFRQINTDMVRQRDTQRGRQIDR